MALNDIEWQGKTIDVDDWDNDRSGFLFEHDTLKWNGTAEDMKELLINYLDGLPVLNNIGWDKTTIESIRLSGNLSLDDKEKEVAIFCTRSYGATEEEKLYDTMGPEAQRHEKYRRIENRIKKAFDDNPSLSVPFYSGLIDFNDDMPPLIEKIKNHQPHERVFIEHRTALPLDVYEALSRHEKFEKQLEECSRLIDIIKQRQEVFREEDKALDEKLKNITKNLG